MSAAAVNALVRVWGEALCGVRRSGLLGIQDPIPGRVYGLRPTAALSENNIFLQICFLTLVLMWSEKANKTEDSKILP